MTLIAFGGLLFYIFLAYCFYRILLRVGYPPWTALLVFLPFVGQAILAAWLAFGRWPLLAHAEAWRDWYESVTDEDTT